MEKILCVLSLFVLIGCSGSSEVGAELVRELILTFYFTQFSLFQSSSPKFKNIGKVSKNNEIHWAKHFS